MTTHLCGAGMAFLGFSLSLFIGLWVENSFITVVGRAVVVLFIFYILGYCLAGLGQKVIIENFESERETIDTAARNDPTVPGETDLDESPQQKPPAAPAESAPVA